MLSAVEMLEDATMLKEGFLEKYLNYHNLNFTCKKTP
jgi:hypothetical protein